MIVFKSDVEQFKKVVDDNAIVELIESEYSNKLGRRPPKSEKRAWNNSMQFMETIVRNAQLPNDCGVYIEYVIPATSKRIDFIVSGHDSKNVPHFVIIELKQWDSAEATDKEDIVSAFVGGNVREVTHPAYQAYSYKRYLSDMNEAIYEKHLTPISCAYLHNYRKKNPEPLLMPQYTDIVNDTPIFFSNDAEKLESFIQRYVGNGNGLGILYQIENGKIRPSRKFVDYVSDVFEGSGVFTLLDEQKIAYSNIINTALHASSKTTIIVNGGPGTGKSVVAMNAFVELLKSSLNIKFVAPNAAFRNCIVDMLCSGKKRKRNRINILFSGSSAFYDACPNEFDVLICDEAHRLKNRNAYMYKGESQTDDVIKASKVNVFFIDDKQRIRPDDEGQVELIEAVATKYRSEVIRVTLDAQFRCSGAEGFLNWIDNTLQITETANYDGWDEDTYEFKLFDNPNELFDAIALKNAEGHSARLLAGYAWPWTSESEGNRNAEVDDVIMPEFGFSMPWNSRSSRETWATSSETQNQVGCVHTSQGLEFDYVGVIIGNDMTFNPENMEVQAVYDEYFDTTGKKGLKDNPKMLTGLIKNIYKVLLSRGMKGCYVFCRDKNLQRHFNNRLLEQTSQ